MLIIDFLNTNPQVFLLAMGIFGLLIGSFLNVVILRLPIMMQREWEEECRFLLQDKKQDAILSADVENKEIPKERFDLIYPRSQCPTCHHGIRPWENIPILSYLFLKGRCSQCQSAIPIRYPLIEFLTSLISLLVAAHFGFSQEAVAALALSYALIALAIIDLDHGLLPDSITLPLLWLGLGLSLWGGFCDPQSSIIGAIAGYGVLWGLYHIFKIITTEKGMGYGDFKLLAVLGAWLGWQSLPAVVLLSSLVGSVVGILLILFRNHKRNTPIPFGPYLAGAGWIALLWGDQLQDFYLL